MTTTEDALLEVFDERMRQDAKYGGVVNDDKNTLDDWLKHIGTYAAGARYCSANNSRDKARRRLVQVAALAVAAVEAMDRGAAR